MEPDLPFRMTMIMVMISPATFQSTPPGFYLCLGSLVIGLVLGFDPALAALSTCALLGFWAGGRDSWHVDKSRSLKNNTCRAAFKGVEMMVLTNASAHDPRIYAVRVLTSIVATRALPAVPRVSEGRVPHQRRHPRPRVFHEERRAG